MDKVYLIEHRTNEKGSISSVNACLVSSLRKAITYMEENKDYDGENDHWWWAIYPMPIDKEPDGEEFDELLLYNKRVERIYWQPGGSEKPRSLGETYEFDLDAGEHTYLNNYMLKGKLVSTDDEKLTFENVDVYQNDILVQTIEKKTFDIGDVHGLYNLV